MNKIHKNCISFKNGRCVLKNKVVDPQGSACPDFKPCPGSKIRSKGKGQALGVGKGKGPKGVPLRAKEKTWRKIALKGKRQLRVKRLGLINLGEITRLLRTIRNLKGKVYVVGGLVTEGSTLKDIDIVITDTKDIPNLKKCLGKFADRAHFIIQQKEPPATLFLKVTGKEGTSPDPYKSKKSKRMPKSEYAGSV